MLLSWAAESRFMIFSGNNSTGRMMPTTPGSIMREVKKTGMSAGRDIREADRSGGRIVHQSRDQRGRDPRGKPLRILKKLVLPALGFASSARRDEPSSPWS